jgi:excisionase family DNA binding protein
MSQLDVGSDRSHGCRWLTSGEAADYLKVKARTLLGWVRQGKIKGYALSGSRRRVWRFRQEDLDACLLGRVPTVLDCETQSVLNKERGI